MRGIFPGTRLVFVFAALLAACVAPPDKEIREAKAAIAEARAAGADQYAPTQLAAATSALRGAEEAVTRHDYRQGASLAVDSRTRARDAARIAAEQKDAERAEAMRAIQDLETAIDAARRRVASGEAPGAAGTRQQQLALSETRRAIVVANVSLQKARAAYAAGDFGGTRQATAGVADHLKAISETK